jgi:hypothetical protein
MFCGIGRDKSNKDDCKKPSKIYKHPSISPLTVKKEADKKSPSRVSVSPISFDVESESSKLADELGLLTVGKNLGQARGLSAYKTKKAGKRRRKRKRGTKKRRKTKKKRKRKRKRRKSKRRK